MKNEEEIWELVDKKKDDFIEFSDRIFDTPEILYKEFQSVSEHTKMLKKEGFKITEGICNMPTAVMGEYGDWRVDRRIVQRVTMEKNGRKESWRLFWTIAHRTLRHQFCYHGRTTI